MKIAVVILNYNTPYETVSCSRKLLGDDRIWLVLVDNGSSDDSEDILRDFSRDNKEVTFVETGFNGGYAFGNNIGIALAAAEDDVDYVCVLNSDVRIQPDGMASLTRYLDENKDVFVVGPTLVEAFDETTIQSAGMKVDYWTGNTPGISRGMAFDSGAEPYRCDMVSGACMVFRARDVGVLGYLPECYFLYYEESEWCVRNGKAGRAVACVANVKAVHKGTVSTAKVPNLTGYLMVRNRVVFLKRNSGMLQTACCVLGLTAEALVSTVLKGESRLWKAGAAFDGLRDTVKPGLRDTVVIGNG